MDLKNIIHKLIQMDQTICDKHRSSIEAERRASFVTGMGGSVCGYADGYQDGFEHAIQWLLDENPCLLDLDYRPSAGMDFSKKYYGLRLKERKELLDRFEKSFTAKKQLSK